MTDTVPTTDVFLSYNRADAEAVRSVQSILQSRGVRTFVDWKDLAAGLPWPDALERALQNARAVAVFVGPSGFGLWQKREMNYALDLQVQAERRGGGHRLAVVPILLRGGDPPAGFLALNTWVDLRQGVSEEALAPLLRSLDGVAAAERPALELCPYRDLRAFREEDAALFFGRDAPVELLVQRVDASAHAVDRAPFVAVVGPSGSGKSSVVMAGVVPRLRRPRAVPLVWDFVSFTPGDHPWRRFADSLMPLLEPELSEARRLEEAAALTTALRQEYGIASAVSRVVEKSGGRKRLLVVVDQFEELFTLTDEHTAREFVRALFAASRTAPFTILLTLRSDYYGKAIALDRELSDTVPESQVNLGPIRREELRDVVVRPAAAAGLTFESGLVDQILDDVGDEPGNLPLLEYALTELWKLRSDGELTFAAYREIGQVSGALARRTNALHDALSDAQQTAARRLMLRLVRVSAADEEGADTRRRVRRSELEEQEWSIVDSFAGPRARLLVVGTDPESGEDVVEVAHEALIRKWNRLREWIDEDRSFLVWRQKLALYRGAWEAAGRDSETLLRGPALVEAQRWLRTRRADLNGQEREFLDHSAAQIARSRSVARFAAAAGLGVVLAGAGAIAIPRTDWYNVEQIKPRAVHATVFDGPDVQRNLTALLKLDLEGRINAIIRDMPPSARTYAWGDFARALQKLSRPRSAKVALRAARRSADALPANDRPRVLVDLAKVHFDLGERHGASGLLLRADEMARAAADFRVRAAVVEEWQREGRSDRAVEVSSDMRRRIPAHPPALRAPALAHTANAFALHGDAATARLLLEEKIRIPEKELAQQVQSAVAHTYVRLGDEDAAFASVAYSPGHLTWIAFEFGRRGDVAAVKKAVTHMPPPFDGWIVERVIAELIKKGHVRDAEELVSLRPDLVDPHNGKRLSLMVGLLADRGDLDNATRIAFQIRTGNAPATYTVIAHALLTEALARAGRDEAAAEAFGVATATWARLVGSERDEAGGALSRAYAAMGDYRTARVMAEAIDDDAERREALLSILRVYADTR